MIEGTANQNTLKVLIYTREEPVPNISPEAHPALKGEQQSFTVY